MSFEIIITGTGTPKPSPGRAGPGVFLRYREQPSDTGILLQVDAGRGTTMRLTEALVALPELTAVFLTHHHSDHVIGLTDLALTRWFLHGVQPYDPLPVYCPEGPAVQYLESLFDQLEPDIESRQAVSNYPDRPGVRAHAFNPASASPLVEVARFGNVGVETAFVDHGDLRPAVGYRFTTPDGVIAVSGDTRACDAVVELARGADVLVHEVFSAKKLLDAGEQESRVENLSRHHSDAPSVGETAARAEVKLLILTHVIPAPVDLDDEEDLIQSIRAGGYAGQILVARDLDFVELGADT